jgi:hypothetical protein
MPSNLQIAGAALPASDFAPLHVNRQATGLWPNTNPLRDASTSEFMESYYGGKKDSYAGGVNCEVSTRLTLIRRPGLSIYNGQIFPPINRFYGWNTFTTTDEAVRVMVDTAATVFDGTGPFTKNAIFTKSPGAGSTYFLGVGNTLYFTNGVDNMQLDNATGNVTKWGVDAPPDAPTVTQQPRPNPYPSWAPGTGYPVYNAARPGMLILDDPVAALPNFSIIPLFGGGNLAIGCGQSSINGATVQLPAGFDTTRLLMWTSPGDGISPSVVTSGVYQSTGGNGVTNSAFQSFSGGFAFNASTNWIAVAWTAGAPVSVTTVGNYTTLLYRTALGDDMAMVFGTGFDQSLVPIPAGFGTANVQWMAGMVGGTTNLGHTMQGVQNCNLIITPTQLIVAAVYNDNDGNSWQGTAGVFAVFYNQSANLVVGPGNNCTVLAIGVFPNQYQSLLFATNIAQGTSFGISGRPVTGSTGAMCGWTPSGTNESQGWSALTPNNTFDGYYQDGQGNRWAGFGNCFGLSAINVPYTGNVEVFNGNGVTGGTEPSPWNPAVGGTTQDNTVLWTNLGPYPWQSSTGFAVGAVVMAIPVSPPGSSPQFFVCSTAGQSGTTTPNWVAGAGLQVADGTVVWTNQGKALTWADLGPNTPITSAAAIVDFNGYMQYAVQPGKSGSTAPIFATEPGALTTDGGVIWQNGGPYAVAGTAPVQYGDAFATTNADGDFIDISNMSPKSVQITVIQGNQVMVRGYGTGASGVTTIILYRTAQGGSTFLFLASFPNPGAGVQWTYIDTTPDADLNTEIQAQVNGEGTPLPVGATCLAYHLGRIFAAVNNVVYVSSGPDAIASGSSGNAGFDTTFTAQSKIVKFWVNSLGVMVLTLRDAYLIGGSATPNDPLYMKTWIEQIPLLHYDAFAPFLSSAYMFGGHRMVESLDPGSGITEASFPIANIANGIDPKNAYLTMHTGGSGETALYLSDGQTLWYRMAPTSAPETGANWSPAAVITGGLSALQSTEVLPGTMALLVGPPAAGGPILYRDTTTYQDNGTSYPMGVDFNPIVLANPGQLAGLAWMTLKCSATGKAPALGVVLDEVDAAYEDVPRTRQDPPNLPPSTSFISNRYSLLQSQKPVWCQVIKFGLTWDETNTPDELLTYTIFGQMWQEQRSQ